MRFFTREAMQEIDRQAVTLYGMSVMALMEFAGWSVAISAGALAAGHSGAVFTIVCGPGNNGGDGLVAARWLYNMGQAVSVFLLAPAERYRDAAGAQLKTVQAMGIPIKFFHDAADFDQPRDRIFVDAIFGTGLTRPVTGLPAVAIEAMNRSGLPVLSVDVPSGLDCDTGQPLGVAVKATKTVTFCGFKQGFRAPGARGYTGEVRMVEIGIPNALLDAMAVKD